VTGDSILRKAPKPRRAKRKPSGPQPLKRSRLKTRGKRSKKSGGQLFHGAKFRDPDYLTWMRRRTCIAFEQAPAVGYGPQHEGRVQAAHVKSRGAGGVDRGNCIPLCARHHAEQHALGLTSFAAKYGLDLRAEALRLQALYESEHPQ